MLKKRDLLRSRVVELVLARPREALLHAGVLPQALHHARQLDRELRRVFDRVGEREQLAGVVHALRVLQADLELAHCAYDRDQRLDGVREHDGSVLQALVGRVAFLVDYSMNLEKKISNLWQIL